MDKQSPTSTASLNLFKSKSSVPNAPIIPKQFQQPNPYLEIKLTG